jgi:hypothetical protein
LAISATSGDCKSTLGDEVADVEEDDLMEARECVDGDDNNEDDDVDDEESDALKTLAECNEVDADDDADEGTDD